jgi:hypothetical protein
LKSHETAKEILGESKEILAKTKKILAKSQEILGGRTGRNSRRRPG